MCHVTRIPRLKRCIHLLHPPPLHRQAALGPTGKEGAFRAACERALSALRAARAPLGGLLALLLEDPGVDWAAEREAQAARRDVDLAVSLNLFASRWALISNIYKYL
jgi:phosphatidylinositol kinase/protein kinase (PI-3  family)